MKAIEKVYKILGEKVFNKFEAEFYFRCTYYSLESHCEMVQCKAIMRAFLWSDSKNGYYYWRKQSLKLRDKWENYE